MVRVLQLTKSDFRATLRRHLECELLDDQFARLSQGGYTDARAIPLCYVFLDLPLEDPGELLGGESQTSLFPDFDPEPSKDSADNAGEPTTFLRYLFKEASEVLKPSMLEPKHQRQVSGRMVLVGGPGQGKTTVGQYACQLFRAALLRASGGAFSPEVEQALERIGEVSAGLPALNVLRYPIRIDLKQLAAALAAADAERSEGLLDYIVRRIAARTQSRIDPDEFRRWLTNYPWLLVLDGLDEVPASSNRQQVMQAIRDFISVEAHLADADLMVLATTRPQGYSDEFDPTFYRHLRLAPLDPQSALLYGSRLATARHPGQRSRVEELTATLTRASTNPAAAHLMQSPLQVTIMLALIEGGGEPPEQRWKLFHDYYDVIYRREKERGTSFSPILRRYEPDIHWIHHRTGWLLQQRNAASGSTNARLTHEEFETMVDRRLRRRGHDQLHERKALVRDIRLAATDRLVFLVGNTDKEIGFEIRSLQEFMAAEHFFDGGELLVKRTLYAIAPYPYWLNSFLFAAGRIFFEREELIDTLIALCGQMNETADDPAQRAILSGSYLAAALLNDGAARNQPKSIRVIARCAARCMDSYREESAQSLAQLFCGEAEPVLKEELLMRLDTDRLEATAHLWILCLKLACAGKSWATQWLEQRFPWENELPNALIDAILGRGQEPVPQQIVEKVMATVTHRSLTSVVYRAVSARGETFLRSFMSLRDRPNPDVLAPLRLGRNSTPFVGTLFAVESDAKLRRWAMLDYPPGDPHEFHPEWRAAWVSSRFARNATHANLVEQMRTLAQMCPAGLKTATRLYPWQIGLCLEARAGGQSWDEIVGAVAQRRLGDESDWRRWTERNLSGITLSRFRIPTQWGVSDECQGLLLRMIGQGSHSVKGASKLADELINAFERWPEIRATAFLIRACCSCLYEEAENSGSLFQVIDRFVSACLKYKIRVSTAVVGAILIDGCTIEQKAKLLVKLGTCFAAVGGPSDAWVFWDDEFGKRATEVISELTALQMSSEAVSDMLYAISFLAPPLSFSVPQIHLRPMESMGGNHCDAALVLKLSSLEWTQGESAALATRTLDLTRSRRTGLLGRLCTLIEKNTEPAPHLEAFLVETLAQAPRTAPTWTLHRVSEVLVKLVERRPTATQLPDPTESIVPANVA